MRDEILRSILDAVRQGRPRLDCLTEHHVDGWYELMDKLMLVHHVV